MSEFFKVKTRPALTPYYSYRAQEICSTSHLETQRLNDLTASATLLPKLLIYYANFANHYVKSKFQFLSMILVASGISNQLKNLFSRHPNIPEVPRNDP